MFSFSIYQQTWHKQKSPRRNNSPIKSIENKNKTVRINSVQKSTLCAQREKVNLKNASSDDYTVRVIIWVLPAPPRLIFSPLPACLHLTGWMVGALYIPFSSYFFSRARFVSLKPALLCHGNLFFLFFFFFFFHPPRLALFLRSLSHALLYHSGVHQAVSNLALQMGEFNAQGKSLLLS